MPTDESSQEEKWAPIIAAILTSLSIPQAAQKAGCSEKTIDRLLASSEPFRTQLRTARRQTIDHSISRVATLSSAAVGVLGTLMADKETPPPTRLAAARSVLEFSLKCLESQDVEARLSALEAAAALTTEPTEALP